MTFECVVGCPTLQIRGHTGGEGLVFVYTLLVGVSWNRHHVGSLQSRRGVPGSRDWPVCWWPGAWRHWQIFEKERWRRQPIIININVDIKKLFLSGCLCVCVYVCVRACTCLWEWQSKRGNRDCVIPLLLNAWESRPSQTKETRDQTRDQTRASKLHHCHRVKDQYQTAMSYRDAERWTERWRD